MDVMDDKDALLRDLQRQLDAWQQKIDALESKAADAAADRQQDYRDAIARLEQTRDRAAQSRDEVREATGQALEDLKAGIADKWDQLRNAVEEVTSRFA